MHVGVRSQQTGRHWRHTVAHAIDCLLSYCHGLLLLQLYKQYRDAMLSLYWEDPSRDLSFADVRQHLDGEVNALTR